MGDRLHIAGLPLYTADPAGGALRFEAGAPFWRAMDQLAAADRLQGQLDDLLAGAPSPRAWLLVHEPGQPHLSAVAALMLSRALTGRGQNVLVLDADEEGAALTIWTEREETEGWIDVARFGASVFSAAVPLPFRGGRGSLLGVGSFVPTEVTEDEIASLLSRLRHQADDIVIVAAANPAALPWARHTDRRLFCWDGAGRAADNLGSVLGPFTSAGVPVTGLIAFGDVDALLPPAVAPPAAIAGQVAVEAPAAKEPDEATAADRFDERDEPIAPDEPMEPMEPDVDDGGTSGSAAVTGHGAPRPPEAAVMPPGLPAETDDGLSGESESPRATPRVFWLAAGVFAAALVAISWYWSEHVRVPPGGYFAPVVTQTGTQADPGAEPATAIQSPPGAMPASKPEETSTMPAAAVDTLLGANLPVTLPSGTPSSGTTLSSAAEVGPGAIAAAAPSIDSTALKTEAAFDPAPYAASAGEAGWALHVYSLPDSAGAARQVADLERAGFRPAVRIVEIPEKGGRWWRLYLGSFPSQKAALAAKPALLAKLGEPWADAAHIQDSAP